MFERAVIVLAAGLSSRMGDVNKLLIQINDTPMIRTTVSAYLEVSDAPVTVITGFEHTNLEASLAGLDVNFVHNPEYASGQKTSVAAGLRAVPDAKSTIIALGDQPLLNASVIQDLLRTHEKSDQKRITIPMNNDARGNPLVIPHALKLRLLQDRDNPGCRKFTTDNPDFVNTFTTQNPAFFTCLLYTSPSPRD